MLTNPPPTPAPPPAPSEDEQAQAVGLKAAPRTTAELLEPFIGATWTASARRAIEGHPITEEALAYRRLADAALQCLGLRR